MLAPVSRLNRFFVGAPIICEGLSLLPKSLAVAALIGER